MHSGCAQYALVCLGTTISTNSLIILDISLSSVDTCADVNHAEHLLGYKSSVTFEEGIKRTIEWYNSPDAVIARDEEKPAGNELGIKRRRLSIKSFSEEDKYYPTDDTYYPLY